MREREREREQQTDMEEEQRRGAIEKREKNKIERDNKRGDREYSV